MYLFAYLAAICRNRVLSALGREKAQKRRGEVVALTAELEQCIPDTRRDREETARDIGEALNCFLAGLGEEKRRFSCGATGTLRACGRWLKPVASLRAR